MGLSSRVSDQVPDTWLGAASAVHGECPRGGGLFGGYRDGRNTLTPGDPDLLNRTLAVKVTRLLRY